MKSTASFHAHPIHPMIVPFPFVFLTAAWGFGVAGEVSGSKDLKTVSRYLAPAGVAAGLLAAVPGIIDYLGSVPPKSSAKERATKHALLNVTSLALFSLGWLAGRTRNRYLPLALQSVGVTTLSMAGWLGGTLVYRNQIGVDHRYANAGKWQEETLSADGTKTLQDAAHGLAVNQMKLVHADDTRIAIARTGKGYAAFQDRCTHKGGPLSDGVLACGTVQCPWHGSQFDVRTGHVKAGPAEKDIETYDLLSEEGKIGA
jgi:uncharacterized membrane protein/nitrite reductase/ring-hydroxylating ferredoxin subunit